MIRTKCLAFGMYVAVAALSNNASNALDSGAYHLAHEIAIGGDGGWDYITVDSVAERLYVSHGKQVEVLEERSGNLIGVIPDTPGVHGIAIAPEFNRGFVSSGGDRSVHR